MKTAINVLLLCILVNVLFFGFVVGLDTVHADSVAKLPAPELVSATYEDYSYIVPANTSIDSFTGKTVENPAYRVEDRKLTIVINKKAVDTTESYVYYKLRMKGSFSNEWIIFTGKFVPVSDSPLTTLVFTSYPSDSVGLEGKLGYGGDSFYLPFEGKADFQVYVEKWGFASVPGMMPGTSSYTDVLVATSDWSNIKTITMGYLNDEQQNQSSSKSPSPNPSGGQSEGFIAGFSLVVCCLLGVVVVVVIMLIAVTFY